MCVLFRCLVIYNDYDNYFERFGQIRETNELFKKIQVFIDSKNHKRNEKIKPLDKEEIVKMLDAYVALGSNVMNGAAAYVSIIYEDHIVVTDPVRGNFFDPSSTSCTFLNIAVVFNDEKFGLIFNQMLHHFLRHGIYIIQSVGNYSLKKKSFHIFHNMLQKLLNMTKFNQNLLLILKEMLKN